MSVNSTKRAKPVTLADYRTLTYVELTADTVFGAGYDIAVLVHLSHLYSNEYLATLTAHSTSPAPGRPQLVDLGLHSGTTREEALLGLLHTLEEMAVKRSNANRMKSKKEDTENKQKSGQLIEEMVEEHNEEI